MTRGDKYLIIFIIITSIVSFVYIKNFASAYDKKYIKIEVDGKEYKKVYFDPKIDGETIEIKTDFGYNILKIKDEKVKIIEADCDDQLCVKQGYISEPGKVNVCLPNKLVVEIVGEVEENEVDYITN